MLPATLRCLIYRQWHLAARCILSRRRLSGLSLNNHDRIVVTGCKTRDSRPTLASCNVRSSGSAYGQKRKECSTGTHQKPVDPSQVRLASPLKPNSKINECQVISYARETATSPWTCLQNVVIAGSNPAGGMHVCLLSLVHGQSTECACVRVSHCGWSSATITLYTHNGMGRKRLD